MWFPLIDKPFSPVSLAQLQWEHDQDATHRWRWEGAVPLQTWWSWWLRGCSWCSWWSWWSWWWSQRSYFHCFQVLWVVLLLMMMIMMFIMMMIIMMMTINSNVIPIYYQFDDNNHGDHDHGWPLLPNPTNIATVFASVRVGSEVTLVPPPIVPEVSNACLI